MQNRKIALRFYLICIFALYFLLFHFYCFASGPGTTGATFLKLAVGSRPASMGEAYVAVADDVNALYWNPAGLAQIKERQANLVATEWFQGIHYSYLGYCQPLLGGVIGGSGTILWIDGIERRLTDGPSEGWIAARDIAVSISYGKTILEKLSLGATIKGISQQLDNYYSGGLALDIGALYKQSGTLNFGVAIQNIGSKGAFIQSSDPLPLNLKLGLANKYLPDRGTHESGLGRYNLTLAADLNYGLIDSILSVGAGIDWQIHPMFAIRGGYKYNNAMSSLGFLPCLTIGGGFKYNIFDIDYAFVPYGDLGYTHRISLLAKF